MSKKKAWMTAVTVGLVFVMALAVPAMAVEKPPTPTEIKGGKVISTDETKALLDKKEAKFFDLRSPVGYGKGHLPGAVSLPYKEKSEYVADFDTSVDEFDMSTLSKDKNTKMVFYSHGPTGWKSYKAAVLAIKAGYKNVMWYRGGIDEWEAKGYPLEK